MVKIVRKRKKINYMALIVFIFSFSSICYLFSSVMLKSYNYNLAIKEGAMSKNIIKLSNDVANLELEVKQLDNRERILEIAEAQGLEVNQESIVSVVDDNATE